MLSWLTRRAERKANAHNLYGSIVALSRSPAIYDTLKVPDTIEGRFEIMLLHMFATLERLNGEAPSLAQDIVNKFFADMDTTSRELGVGDMVVPKKMRGLASIFETRMKAYESAVADSNKKTLSKELHDTIFNGEEGSSDSALGLVKYLMQLRKKLAKIPLAELVARQIAVPVKVGTKR
jgi:cytochrome b pre-mRNA-processing protein 3